MLFLMMMSLFSTLIESRLESIPPASLWPQPKSVKYGNSTFLLANSFKIFTNNQSTKVLEDAITRYTAIIQASNKTYFQFNYPQRTVGPVTAKNFLIQSLELIYTNKDYSLQYGFDESYQISVDVNSFITAPTQWGILRGLETFSQLIQWNETNQIIQSCPIRIEDQPRFKWRGLMIDTARHFVPLQNIRLLIDGMVYDKLNVFHWHLTDAESFSIEIKSRPKLTQEGAYTKTLYYSQEDVIDIINYAYMRGIRVIPELDTPGHTFSWGNAYPNIILECANMIARQARSMGYPGINNAPFDMTNPELYPILKDVMSEIVELFPDNYIHLGGDEVSSRCIDEFPRIKIWMKEHNMNTSSYTPLVNFYTKSLIDIIKTASPTKKMLFWAEVFNGGKNPMNPKNTLVHVWEKENRDSTIKKAITEGFETIVSAAWYLDVQIPSYNGTLHYLYQDTWMDFYNDDPLQGLSNVTPDKLKLILGGEICQWGEAIGPESITSWLWPRTSAAAERLWSQQDVTMNNSTLTRLMTHNCRIRQRGIKAMNLRPDYCQI